MREQSAGAEVDICLRVRMEYLNLIDQAAKLVGANRSQFMIASALTEAKAFLLDQSAIHVDIRTFREVMDWMDAAASPSEIVGMKRLLQAKAPCHGA
jgi:uncharacterized protein (DUF1778 family)